MILCLTVLCALDASAAGKRRAPRKGIASKAVFQARVSRSVKRQCARPGRLGLYIRSVSTAQTLFSHHAATSRIPASNVKLFTAAAALSRLGPDYRFATDIYVKGKFRGGVVRGDIYLKGYGDPLFVHETMRDFVRRLKLRGVRRITGDLVADDSYFDRKKHGRGWRVGRSIRPYLAPHGALSLNFGLANVLVAPGERVGDPALAHLEPPSRALRLQAKVKTSRGRRLKIRLGRRRSKGQDVVEVRGWFPAGNRMRTYRVPVTDPTAFNRRCGRYRTRETGNRLQGKDSASRDAARCEASGAESLATTERSSSRAQQVQQQFRGRAGTQDDGCGSIWRAGYCGKRPPCRAGFPGLHRNLGEGDRSCRWFRLEQDEPRLPAFSGGAARSGSQRFQAASRVHGVPGRVRRRWHGEKKTPQGSGFAPGSGEDRRVERRARLSADMPPPETAKSSRSPCL